MNRRIKPTAAVRKVTAAIVSLVVTSLLVLQVFRPTSHLLRQSSNPSLRFFVIGDWGTNDKHQKLVAKHMYSKSKQFLPSFVLSTGDQMYNMDKKQREIDGIDGVASIFDSSFQSKFEDMYSKLKVPWYMTLGNHDCSGNGTAEILYSQHSPSQLWKMPSRYYTFSTKLGLGNTKNIIQTIVLDSCSLACAGGKNDRCHGVKLPFDSSDKQVQLQWLKNLLETGLPTTDSIYVIVSHWPIFSMMGNGPTEIMIKEIEPMLEEATTRGHKVIWFNGHDHGLQHIQRRKNHYFVSGAGGFKLHSALKRSADGAYVEKGTGLIKSTLNEMEDVNIQFSRACFGFISVEINDSGKVNIELYESKPNAETATMIYTVMI